MPSKEERREALKSVYEQARGLRSLPAAGRGAQHRRLRAGNADADLMFVGEAPGANEDKTGLPFVGQAGKLLDKLLDEIGLVRGDVFIANVLKCRPPATAIRCRPRSENCQDYLLRHVELIEPRVICTLGNFATKLLRGEPTGITRVHGQAEIRRDRRPRGAPVPDLPPGRGRSTRRRTSRCCVRTSRGCPPCWRSTPRRQPGGSADEPEPPEPDVAADEAPLGGEPVPASQLGLF